MAKTQFLFLAWKGKSWGNELILWRVLYQFTPSLTLGRVFTHLTMIRIHGRICGRWIECKLLINLVNLLIHIKSLRVINHSPSNKPTDKSDIQYSNNIWIMMRWSNFFERNVLPFSWQLQIKEVCSVSYGLITEKSSLIWTIRYW